MSVSFNPTQATNSQVEAVENKKEEPKTSLFKIPSVKKLILGALATQGAAMAPRANAAFGSYAICVAMCTATGTPPPICLAACTVTTPLPF
jgi:hypothetical protein